LKLILQPKQKKKKLDSGFKELSTENFQSGSQVEVINNHSEQTISATVTVSPQLIQTTTIEQPTSEHSNDVASLPTELETDVDDNNLTDNHLIQLETNQNYEQVHLNQTISQQNNFNSDADFQKAIEIFIKNFEGEIAVLSDYDSETEDEAETTMITPEYQSNLPSKLIDQAKVVNHTLKDHLKLTGGRPDLSDYEDDDDIPFVRPVSYKSDNERLFDSWEVAANRPGVWLYGSRGLFL
jgi:DNA polymerase-3 subunit gamma/tau